MALNCLIIGAGMAGLTAARELKSQGWTVKILDKSRGVGGRMATRRIGTSKLDHGAQFFTVRDPRFAAAVAEWEATGAAAPWFSQDGHTRYYGVDGMSGIAKHLASTLDVRTDRQVGQIESVGSRWIVLTSAGEPYEADALILTPPAPQSIALCSGISLADDVLSELQAVEFHPCLALMTVGGVSRVPAPGYVRPEGGPIAWIADNTQKGISSGSAALTLHATPEFSRIHWDAPSEETVALMLDSVTTWLNDPLEWELHRWRYSQPIATRPEPCLFTASPAPLAFAGDAFAGPRVEGAFLSGLAAANMIRNAWN